MRISENGELLHVGDNGSEDEQGGRTRLMVLAAMILKFFSVAGPSILILCSSPLLVKMTCLIGY